MSPVRGTVADRATLLSFTLIGLYVGVIPVFLGMFWFLLASARAPSLHLL